MIAKIKRFSIYALFGISATLVYARKVNSNLVFSFEPTAENRCIIEGNSVLRKGKYQATYYLLWGPLQWLYSRYFQAEPYFRVEDELVYERTLRWIPMHNRNQSSSEAIPIVLFLTGAEGFDLAIKNLMTSVYRYGFLTVGLDPVDFFDEATLGKVLDHIKKKNPSSKIYGIGLDYGANLLVNFTANNPKTFQAIVSIANPLDLELSQINLSKSFIWRNLSYPRVLEGRLKRLLELSQISQESAKITRSLLQLPPVNKQTYSSINSISKLETRALFIQSQESPFSISLDSEPRIENPYCIFVETPRGGNQEWFESSKCTRWIFRPVSRYLHYMDKIFNQNSQKPTASTANSK